jgi:hypothetical protein
MLTLAILDYRSDLKSFREEQLRDKKYERRRELQQMIETEFILASERTQDHVIPIFHRNRPYYVDYVSVAPGQTYGGVHCVEKFETEQQANDFYNDCVAKQIRVKPPECLVYKDPQAALEYYIMKYDEE